MIIDTHVHIYNPFRPEGAPWPDPKNELLYRPTLPLHLKAQAVPEGVVGAVVVEASAWISDNQWILDLAAAEPFILGLVGRLEPDDAGFEADLDRLASQSLFRGVRFWGDYFTDLSAHGFVDKMRQLAARDLVLDVNFPCAAADGFFALLEQVPELRVVVEHVGQVPVNGQEPPQQWLDRMRRAAEHPQTSMKVSALMEHSDIQPAPPDVDYYRQALNAMWDLFGPERMFFGSNWPVCERAGTYARCTGIVREYCQERGARVSDAFFFGNAQRIYRIQVRV